MALNILFEDDTLQVVDKPAGLDVKELERLLEPKAKPAHRLDKDTSGVLVVAKNEDALRFLQTQFQERKVHKTYHCLVEGELKNEKGTITTLLGRSPGDRRKQKAFLPREPGSENKREAVTHYEVNERFKGYTFLEVHPETGRKHQIRAHLSHLGHPIAGDKLYGFKNQKVPKGLTRQFLHASALKILLPNGNEATFVSPLPKELKEVLKQQKAL